MSWFEEKLTVGGFPDENFDPKQYDYQINVSDEFYPEIDAKIRKAGCQTFWFPMNEVKKDIGFNSIYGACTILHQAEQENARVYLHCHAGVNRSRIVWAAYYFMRNSKHLEDTTRSGNLNMLIRSCNKGYLPVKDEMENFLLTLNAMLDCNNMQGGLLDNCKIETITNF